MQHGGFASLFQSIASRKECICELTLVMKSTQQHQPHVEGSIHATARYKDTCASASPYVHTFSHIERVGFMVVPFNVGAADEFRIEITVEQLNYSCNPQFQTVKCCSRVLLTVERVSRYPRPLVLPFLRLFIAKFSFARVSFVFMVKYICGSFELLRKYSPASSSPEIIVKHE